MSPPLLPPQPQNRNRRSRNPEIATAGRLRLRRSDDLSPRIFPRSSFSPNRLKHAPHQPGTSLAIATVMVGTRSVQNPHLIRDHFRQNPRDFQQFHFDAFISHALRLLCALTRQAAKNQNPKLFSPFPIQNRRGARIQAHQYCPELPLSSGCDGWVDGWSGWLIRGRLLLAAWMRAGGGVGTRWDKSDPWSITLLFLRRGVRPGGGVPVRIPAPVAPGSTAWFRSSPVRRPESPAG